MPASMEALVELPGVGRKTANVVLGHALGVPGLPVDRHVLPGARVAPRPCRAVLDRKRAESAQFHAVTAGERGHDLAQDRIDDVFDIALVEVRILSRNALNKL